MARTTLRKLGCCVLRFALAGNSPRVAGPTTPRPSSTLSGQSHSSITDARMVEGGRSINLDTSSLGSLTSTLWSRRHLMIDLPRYSKPVDEECEVRRPKRFLKADLHDATLGQAMKDASCVFRLLDV